MTDKMRAVIYPALGMILLLVSVTVPAISSSIVAPAFSLTGILMFMISWQQFKKRTPSTTLTNALVLSVRVSSLMLAAQLFYLRKMVDIERWAQTSQGFAWLVSSVVMLFLVIFLITSRPLWGKPFSFGKASAVIFFAIYFAGLSVMNLIAPAQILMQKVISSTSEPVKNSLIAMLVSDSSALNAFELRPDENVVLSTSSGDVGWRCPAPDEIMVNNVVHPLNIYDKQLLVKLCETMSTSEKESK